MSKIKYRPFSLGRHIVATPGVLEAASREWLLECLQRHTSGDWGCIDPDDATANNLATHDGSRILSAYPIDPTKPCKGYGDNCIWIITDAGDDNGIREATTLLLPDEY